MTVNERKGVAPGSAATAAATAGDDVGAGLGLRFHHIGVAVKSLAAALDHYVGTCGFRQIADPVEVPSEGVRVCFVEAPPGVLVELVEAATEDSAVRGVIERNGPGPYHLCYEVDDLDRALRQLRRRRCRPFRRFELAAHGLRRFAFVVTPDLQLMELCEPDRT